MKVTRAESTAPSARRPMARRSGRPCLLFVSSIALPALLMTAFVQFWPGPIAAGETGPWEDEVKAIQDRLDQKKFEEAERAARSLLAHAEEESGPASSRAAAAIDLLVKDRKSVV